MSVQESWHETGTHVIETHTETCVGMCRYKRPVMRLALTCYACYASCCERERGRGDWHCRMRERGHCHWRMCCALRVPAPCCSLLSCASTCAHTTTTCAPILPCICPHTTICVFSYCIYVCSYMHPSYVPLSESSPLINPYIYAHVYMYICIYVYIYMYIYIQIDR